MTGPDRSILRTLCWTRKVAPRDDKRLAALKTRGLVASKPRWSPDGPDRHEWRITTAGIEALGWRITDQEEAA